MTDQLMQEVTDAAINMQQVAAQLEEEREALDYFRTKVKEAEGTLESMTKYYEQARTRLNRAALALDPSTSMEN